MKRKILSIVFFVLFLSAFAQTDILYFKDSLNVYSKENIVNVNFKPIPQNNIILDKFSNASYWFKIPKKNTDSIYVFSVKSIAIEGVLAFQISDTLNTLAEEPFPTFKFNRLNDVYIKVQGDKKIYFPVQLVKEFDFYSQEKKVLLLNGFYYGFSFLILLYSFVYYYFFKDKSYLYYGLFLSSITLGFLIIDGTFFIFNFSRNTVNFLIILNYVLLAFFSSKFVNSFLLLEDYYPNLKKYTYTLGVLIILLAISFLLFEIQVLYITLSVLVFGLLFIYWLTSVILFKENVFTKILAVGFFLLLFSSINTLVLTNFGFSVINMDSVSIKLGGFVQIIVIWFAQIYREKYLRERVRIMKEEIISYSKSEQNNEDKDLETLINSLSIREREIFYFILDGLSNKQIAQKINISINTVKFHIKNIYEKLDVKNRREAINLQVNS